MPPRPTSHRFLKYLTEKELHFWAKRWAIQLANRWHLSGTEVDDLTSEAAMAIMHAADKFKPAKGKFMPYAFTWAKACMERYHNVNSGPVRGGTRGKKGSRQKGAPTTAIELISNDDHTHEQPSASFHVDNRTCSGMQEESLYVREVMAQADERTATLLRARMYEQTMTEAGAVVGLTREGARQSLFDFGRRMRRGAKVA